MRVNNAGKIGIIICLVALVVCTITPPNNQVVDLGGSETIVGFAKKNNVGVEGATVSYSYYTASNVRIDSIVDTTDNIGAYSFKRDTLDSKNALIEVAFTDSSSKIFKGIVPLNNNAKNDTITIPDIALETVGMIRGTIANFGDLGILKIEVSLLLGDFILGSINVDSLGAFAFPDLPVAKYNLSIVPDSPYLPVIRYNDPVFANDTTTIQVGTLYTVSTIHDPLFIADTLVVRKIFDANNFAQPVADYIKLSVDNRISELTIAKKSIATLPDCIGDLLGLSRLDVSGNNLSALPDTLYSLPKLQYLNVSNNKIKNLSESLGKCTTLVSLNCSENLIDLIPQSVGMLSNLRMFFAQGNRITNFPVNITNCPLLQTLQIDRNFITSLPAQLDNCRNLQRFNCSNNLLVSCPESISHMFNLEMFDVSNNQLDSLPSDIGYAPALKFLVVSKNKLAYLPSNIGLLSGLQELSADSNNLTTLPSGITSLKGLREFGLNKNKLCTLDSALIKWVNGYDPNCLTSQICSQSSYLPVVIETPAGREVYTPGMTIPITWRTNTIDKHDVTNVTIEISVNGGKSYNTIVANVGKGYRDWLKTYYLIPDTLKSSQGAVISLMVSAFCKIRIRDYYNPSLNIVSDSTFSIVPQDSIRPLELLSPHSNEIYSVGDSMRIAWKTNGMSQYDINRIALACSLSVDNGLVYYPLPITSLITANDVLWNKGIAVVIPDSLSDSTTNKSVLTKSTQCKVKITDAIGAASGGAYFKSFTNGFFTIQ